MRPYRLQCRCSLATRCNQQEAHMCHARDSFPCYLPHLQSHKTPMEPILTKHGLLRSLTSTCS